MVSGLTSIRRATMRRLAMTFSIVAGLAASAPQVVSAADIYGGPTISRGDRAADATVGCDRGTVWDGYRCLPVAPRAYYAPPVYAEPEYVEEVYVAPPVYAPRVVEFYAGPHYAYAGPRYGWRGHHRHHGWRW